MSVLPPFFSNIISSGDPSSGSRLTKQEPSETDSPIISDSVAEVFSPDHRAMIAIQEQTRIQRFQFFLKLLVQDNEVEHTTATLAWNVWKALSNFSDKALPVPNVGAGPDGEILFSWNHEEHHFELEIYPSGIGEFFYLNYQTDDVWECDYHVGNNIPENVKNKLNHFSLYG